MSGVFFELIFAILDDTSANLFLHLSTMSGLLEECQEVIFEKYLELCILSDLNSSIARLICDERLRRS